MEVKIFYGPPGTGKTTELMQVLDYEINKRGVDTKRIAFVSFSKKAAEEGTVRALQQFNKTMEDFPHFRTAHSTAFRGVKATRSQMMDARKYREFGTKIGMDLSGYYSEEMLQGRDDDYLFYDNLYRNNPKYSSVMLDTLDKDRVVWFIRQYRRYKDTFRFTDFTDLMELYIKGDFYEDVDVAIIDEAQDLTTLQWQMLTKAFSRVKRLYIAGDDDQAIYQWSGADVEYFLNLVGNKVVLDKSYRLPDNFVQDALRMTKNIKRRVDKAYSGQGGIGKKNFINSADELIINNDQSYFLLARNNCFLKQYTERLQNSGVPYCLKGEPFLSQRDVQAIKMWSSFVKRGTALRPDEKHKFSRIVGEPYKLEDWFEAFNWPQEKKDFARTLAANGRIEEQPLVNISTIHGVKGGEADHVVLLTDITRPVATQLDKDADSEHRCFYVGMTRARKELTIVLPNSKYSYDYLF